MMIIKRKWFWCFSGHRNHFLFLFVYTVSIKLGSIILLSAFRGVLFVNVGYL